MPMISQAFPNDDGQEQRANKATLYFIADLIHEPLCNPPQDPQAALSYLITFIAGGDPARLQRICRLAWGYYTANPEKGRWPCVWDARWEIERIDAGLPPLD